MNRLLMVLLVFTLLTACGQSTFDASMRAGKDSLQSGDYKTAIEQFDIALIERPSDKDANILIERAKNELSLQQAKEILPQYQEENSKNFADFTKLFLETSMNDDINEEFITTKLVELREIQRTASDIGRTYNRYPEIREAHDEYINALNAYIDLLEEISKIYSDVERPSVFRTRQYRGLHDDYLQSYKDKIALLKE